MEEWLDLNPDPAHVRRERAAAMIDAAAPADNPDAAEPAGDADAADVTAPATDAANQG